MPRLKDIDVARLCGLKRDHEDSQTNENKKRKSGQSIDDLESETANENKPMTKEEKIKALKERYLQRQRK